MRDVIFKMYMPKFSHHMNTAYAAFVCLWHYEKETKCIAAYLKKILDPLNTFLTFGILI